MALDFAANRSAVESKLNLFVHGNLLFIIASVVPICPTTIPALVSLVAPLDPRVGRANSGVEQSPLGHRADHGAAIVRAGPHVADRFRLFGGDLADLFRQCFAENLTFQGRFSAFGANWRWRDGTEDDAHTGAFFIVRRQVVGNGDADISQIHHLARRELDIFANQTWTAFGNSDFGDDLVRVHHTLSRTLEEFLDKNFSFAAGTDDGCNGAERHERR